MVMIAGRNYPTPLVVGGVAGVVVLIAGQRLLGAGRDTGASSDVAGGPASQLQAGATPVNDLSGDLGQFPATGSDYSWWDAGGDGGTPSFPVNQGPAPTQLPPTPTQPAPAPAPAPAPTPAPTTSPTTTTATYRLVVKQRTNVYSRPGGSVVDYVISATFTCTRSLSGGQWWYRIIGGNSRYLGKYLPAEPWFAITRLT
jgi:hypothetical protein